MAINRNKEHTMQLRWMWVFGLHDTLRWMQPDTDGLGCEYPTPQVWQSYADNLIIDCQIKASWRPKQK